MLNFIQTKPLVSFILAGIMVTGYFTAQDVADLQRNSIDPITFQGQTINFPYTDDNKNENLIIRTDKANYNSWGDATVYFAVKNVSGVIQSTDIQFLYAGSEDVTAIEELQKDIPVQVEVKDYDTKETCKDVTDPISKGVTNYCEKAVIGTHIETQYKDELAPAVFRKSLLTAPLKADVAVAPVEFKPKQGVTYTLEDGQTRYFKAKLKYNPRTKGEFYIKAVGSDNATGVLDPTYTSSDWKYWKAITIDHTKVPSNQTDFPVLVDITDSNLASYASSTGADILFTSDKSTKLNHEIELYASTTGRLTAWVKVPSLSSSVDTVIYMHYGNIGATDQSNATGVWDSNFKQVYHLKNGTTLSTTDSTGVYNATQSGSPTAISAKIDGGATFVAASSQKADTSSSPNFGTNTDFTASAWMKTTDTGNTVAFGNYNGTADYWYVSVGTDGSGKIRYNIDGNSINSGATTMNDGVWHYVVSKRTSGVGYIFIDNTQVATAGSMNNDAGSSGAVFSIGSLGASLFYYNGSLDELRVSGSYRSNDWNTTEYNNQSATSTFYTLGTQQGETIDGYCYYKTITIDHTKVASSTTETYPKFPVLIDLTDSSLKATSTGGRVYNYSGYDISFATSTSAGTFIKPSELEYYASTTGQYIAWVAPDSIATSTDTVLYMFYNNSNVLGGYDIHNTTGVWDSNHKGVWHLPNGTTLTANDSTSNAHNGTLTNSPTAISAKIDGGAHFFDLSGQRIDMGVLSEFNGASKVTISGWARKTSGSTKIGGGRDSGAGIARAGWYWWDDNNIYFIADDGSAQAYGTYSLISPDVWHYIVLVYDGGMTGTARIAGYVDGVKQTLSYAGTPPATLPTDVTNTFNIGRANGGTYLYGDMDEFRFMTATSSADWIKTSYNNQSATSTFYTIGNETATGFCASGTTAYPTIQIQGQTNFSGQTKI